MPVSILNCPVGVPNTSSKLCVGVKDTAFSRGGLYVQLSLYGGDSPGPVVESLFHTHSLHH